MVAHRDEGLSVLFDGKNYIIIMIGNLICNIDVL